MHIIGNMLVNKERWGDITYSPRIAWQSVDFPDPTSPTRAVREPAPQHKPTSTAKQKSADSSGVVSDAWNKSRSSEKHIQSRQNDSSQ